MAEEPQTDEGSPESVRPSAPSRGWIPRSFLWAAWGAFAADWFLEEKAGILGQDQASAATFPCVLFRLMIAFWLLAVVALPVWGRWRDVLLVLLAPFLLFLIQVLVGGLGN